MKNRFWRKIALVGFLSVILGAISLCKENEAEAFGFSEGAVSLETALAGDKIQVSLFVNPGFGIQKDGPHEIIIYTFDPAHTKAASLSEKIKLYGLKREVLSPAVFTGKEAKEDAEYFSAVNPVLLEKPAASPVAVRARIYYCSFLDNFCSVQVLDRMIDFQ